jgi:hypothetical protein
MADGRLRAALPTARRPKKHPRLAAARTAGAPERT